MLNIFSNSIFSSRLNNLKDHSNSNKPQEKLDAEFTSLFDTDWNSIKNDVTKLEEFLKEREQNGLFKFNITAVGDSLDLHQISQEDIQNRIEELKKEQAKKEKAEKDKKDANKSLNKASVASSQNGNKKAAETQKTSASKTSTPISNSASKSTSAQTAPKNNGVQNPFRSNSVKINTSAAVNDTQEKEDEENGKGVFVENSQDRKRAVSLGKFEKSKYTGSSNSGGARYKGIKIAAAAEGYNAFIDGRKHKTENSLHKAKNQRTKTKKEQFQRKQAPKTKSIVPNAGEIEDLQNTRKGTIGNIGSAKNVSQSPNIQMSKHSQGAAEAMGKVSGSVENIKQDFTQKNNDKNCEDFKEIMSAVDSTQQSEQGGIQSFQGARTATSSLEKEQEKNAVQGDAAVEKAIESGSEKEVANETITNALSQMSNADNLTKEGNSDIDEGMSVIDEAKELAGEAESLAGESSKLQSEGLKKLQESTKKMQKGVNLTKKGDQLTGAGQALIHGGVPLTYSIFTVGIGVAMISTGLGLAAAGKAKTNSGNNQVAQGKKAREAGMKKFDNGTKKANEAKEKQDEATSKNTQATELSDGGSEKIQNAQNMRNTAKEQQREGEQKFSTSDKNEKRYTAISISSAKATERTDKLIQGEVQRSQRALNTMLSAKTNAEELTGIKGNGANQTGVGEAHNSNVKPDDSHGSGKSKGLGSAIAGIFGDAFNMSDAMKNIGYKKSLKKDKKQDKKANDKNKQKQANTKNVANKTNGNKNSNSSIFSATATNKVMKNVSIFARG